MDHFEKMRSEIFSSLITEENHPEKNVGSLKVLFLWLVKLYKNRLCGFFELIFISAVLISFLIPYLIADESIIQQCGIDNYSFFITDSQFTLNDYLKHRFNPVFEIYPDMNETRMLVNESFVESGKVIFSKSRQKEKTENNNLYNIGFEGLSSKNKFSNIRITGIPSFLIPEFINTFFHEILPKFSMNLRLTSSYANIKLIYEYSEYIPMSYCLTYAYLLVFVYHIIRFGIMNNKKVVYMIEATGIPTKTVWGGFFLAEIPFILITSLVYSCVYCARFDISDELIKFFVLFFLVGVTMFILSIAFLPSFDSNIKLSFYVGFLLSIFTAGWVITLAHNDFIYFLPNASISSFIRNFEKCYFNDYNKRNILKHLASKFTNYEIFANLVMQMVIYSFISVFVICFFPRTIGTPKINWKNIFSFKHWVALFFNKKKQYEESDEIINDNNNNTPFIEVQNLKKCYRLKNKVIHAVDDVNFCLKKGDIVLLIGPNGSGKSTLLSSFTGCITADSGSVLINGELASFNDIKESVGFCFQESVFFPNTSIREHLEFFGQLRGLSGIKLDEEVDRISTMLKLNDMLDQNCTSLSGGIARIVSVAMAYIGQPKLVILDEPTAGVDAINRQLIWKFIACFCRTTTIVSSHSLEEGESIATKIFVLYNGRMLYNGSPAEVRTRFKCGYKINIIAKDGHDVEDSLDKTYEFVHNIISNATPDIERNDSIIIQSSNNIASLLEELDNHIDELGCSGYTLTVESLEDILLKIIAESEE